MLILAQKKQFSTMPNWKKVSTNKCDIDRQVEIAVWPSKKKYLNLWQYDRYRYNSDGKPGVFNQGKLAESVNKWL